MVSMDDDDSTNCLSRSTRSRFWFEQIEFFMEFALRKSSSRLFFHTILAFALAAILPPAPKLSFAKYKPVVSLSGKTKVFRR